MVFPLPCNAKHFAGSAQTMELPRKGITTRDYYPRYMSKVNGQNKRIDGGNVYVTALFIL